MSLHVLKYDAVIYDTIPVMLLDDSAHKRRYM